MHRSSSTRSESGTSTRQIDGGRLTDRIVGVALLGQAVLFYLLTGGLGLETWVPESWAQEWARIARPTLAVDEVTQVVLPIAAALIGVVGFAIAWLRAGRFRTHLAVAIAQMAISVLWVHVATETAGPGAGRAHAIFSLAIVASFADQRILLFAVVVAMTQSVGQSLHWSESGADPVWPALEHAAYLLAVSGALVFAVHRVKRSAAPSTSRCFTGRPHGRLITRLNEPQGERASLDGEAREELPDIPLAPPREPARENEPNLQTLPEESNAHEPEMEASKPAQIPPARPGAFRHVSRVAPHADRQRGA